MQGSNDTITRSLAGAGTLVFAGGEGSTRLDMDGFSGTLDLQAGAAGLRLETNQLSANRFDLTNSSSAGVVVSLYGTGGADSGAENGVMLNNLEGNISFNAYESDDYNRTYVDVQMTRNNEWTGQWDTTSGGAYSGNKMGSLRVGSAVGEHYEFTMTQGQTITPNGAHWQYLEIQNASVILSEDATWEGDIRFTSTESELRFEGNSVEMGTLGSGESAGYFKSVSVGSGSIVVNTGDELNVVGINRAAASYTGAVSVESGTLSLKVAQAFDSAKSMSVSGGVLEFNNLAQAVDVSMSGGRLTGTAAWTGDLTVSDTGSGSATVDALNGGSVIVDAGASLQLAANETTQEVSTMTIAGTVQSDSSLQVNVGIDIASSGDLRLTEGKSITAAGITLTANAGGGEMSTQESAMRRSSATGSITADSITGMDINNMSIAGTADSSTITDSTITNSLVKNMILTNVTLGTGAELGEGVRVFDSTLASLTVIEVAAVDFTTVEGEDVTGVRAYEISGIYDMLAGTAAEGSLTLDLDGITGFTQPVNGELVAFVLADSEITKLGDIISTGWYEDVDILIGGEMYAVRGAAMSNGSVLLYIPEPSTASLSLLALAGLLARRRRKQA